MKEKKEFWPKKKKKSRCLGILEKDPAGEDIKLEWPYVLFISQDNPYLCLLSQCNY